jgi:hypothetical protein
VIVNVAGSRALSEPRAPPPLAPAAVPVPVAPLVPGLPAVLAPAPAPVVVDGGAVTEGGSGPVPLVTPAGGALAVFGAALAAELGLELPAGAPQPHSRQAASAAVNADRLKVRPWLVDNSGKESGCQMPSQTAQRSDWRRKPLEYDALRRRLWIFGQRCHHGAAGSLAAVLACAGLIAEPSQVVRPAVVALAAGSALMVHDWKDRSIWFERGYGTQL